MGNKCQSLKVESQSLMEQDRLVSQLHAHMSFCPNESQLHVYELSGVNPTSMIHHEHQPYGFLLDEITSERDRQLTRLRSLIT